MTTERIDLNALNELKEILEDEFDHLIATYIQDTQNKLDRLKAAASIANSAEVRELAHSIKGASINIGVMRLSELCQQMESAAVSGQVPEYQAQVAGIDEEVGHVLALLKTQGA